MGTLIGIRGTSRIALSILLLSILTLTSSCTGSPGQPSERSSASPQALKTLFRSLHRPILEVYGLGSDRDAIHAHLATSFRGEALTREYVEHFTALAHMRKESTAIRILRVDYERIDILEQAPTFVRIDADWSVGGIVTHQQHRHPRTNRYQAVYDLAFESDGWRFVGSRLRDMSRIRGFSSLTDGDPWAIQRMPKSGGGMMSPLDLLKAGMTEDVEALRREREQKKQGPDQEQAQGQTQEQEP